jgi:hypothetical protein
LVNAEVEKVRILDWRVECDPEATQEAHGAMSSGAPEECRCADCLNFVAGRHLAYPAEALKVFSKLGIQPDRESSVAGAVKLSSDSYQYNGWFHFVGRLLIGPKTREVVAEIREGADIGPGVIQQVTYQNLTDNFEIALSERTDLLPPELMNKSVVQFEFVTELPWMIDEPRE